MNAPFLRSALLASCLIARAIAAEEAEAEPKPHMKDVIKARVAEEAKKKVPAPTPKPPLATPATSTTSTTSAAPGTPANSATPPAPATNPGSTSNPAAAANATSPPPQIRAVPSDATPPAAKTNQGPATVLPKVEVKKDRITVLDHQLQEQEKEIAREKKNTKPSELDKALNDSKVSSALSILGGQSNQYRANIAKERVSLMEDEKDILEEIAHAKTKAEKDELQKQLDEIKAMRRELEKNLR